MNHPAPTRVCVRLPLAPPGMLLAACLCATAAPAAAVPRPGPAQVAAANAATVAALAPDPRDARWRHIVIHHTAGESDSLAGINAWHARRFSDPLGIQYHFLIGNGRSAPDGAIQIARWRHRAQSIHVVHPARAPVAITVSLQGNLHTHAPSPAQMAAVELLVRRLMQVYAIPAERISTNTRVDGTFTVCPGKYFPFDRLIHRLQHAGTVSAADWRDPLAPVPLDGPFADLEAVRAALRWDLPCSEPIAVGPAIPLQVAVARRTAVQAQLLGIEGGRGCTAITRRLLALRASSGWYMRELNGYRAARLRLAELGDRVRVQVADEQGPVLTCGVRADEAPSCGPVRPKRGRGSRGL